MRRSRHWFSRSAVLILVIIIYGARAGAEEPLRVAVFKGDGVGQSVVDLLEVLGESGLGVSRITAEQIRSGALSEFDVLVHPGGSGSKQGKALGEAGRQTVRQFVKDGGGYLGVCAGSYLATNDYTWSLNLIDAKVLDRLHWARGKGRVSLLFSAAGAEFFGVATETELYYGQGPLLARREWDDATVPDYQSLAIYESEIAKNGAPRGVMRGTSAIVRAEFGAGRVFCFSPHPELTEGRGEMLVHSIAWLVGREVRHPALSPR
ncbi:MAG: BPL-N domain-containing protein [Planctomycetota bacterium]